MANLTMRQIKEIALKKGVEDFLKTNNEEGG
jgi:hypothetical protein